MTEATAEIVKRKPGRPFSKRVDLPPTVADDAPVDDLRRDMRPQVRDEDPRAAAAKRAQEILGQLGDSFDEQDEFFVPPHLIPDGWSYEWKKHSVGNKEDVGYINSCLRTGWTYVPPSRAGHEIFLPTGWKEKYILKNGVALMERPLEITKLVNERMLKEARAQTRIKDDQLNSKVGADFARSNNGQSLDKIKRTIEGPIPNK